MDTILHDIIKEKLFNEVGIRKPQVIGEYWEIIKKVILSLNLESIDNIEDFGIMYEVFYSDNFWEVYFTIQVALQEDGEYSHIEHSFISCQIPKEHGALLKNSCEDLWIGNEETLAKIFLLVESNEYFTILKNSISNKTVIDSTEI